MDGRASRWTKLLSIDVFDNPRNGLTYPNTVSTWYYRMIIVMIDEEQPLGARGRAPSSHIGNVYTNVFHSQRPIFCAGNSMQTQVAKDAPLTEGPDTSCVAAPCPPHSIGESVAAGCDCEPGYAGALGRRKKLHRQETPNSAGGRKPMQQIQATVAMEH